ncbi:MAG: hypothetical protein ACI8UR_001082 [Natronomonas sp.]|jgi:hypothetical protein
MTWSDLFDRAAAYDVGLDDVTETLEASRDDG